MDHVAIAKETTEGTYVTPSTCVSGIVSAGLTIGENRIDRRESGRTRGMVTQDLGTHMPTLSLESIVDPKEDAIVRLFQSLGMTSITTSTPGGATTARDHVLLMDDDAALVALSVQLQQERMGVTTTMNGRGMQVGSITISGSTDNYVNVSAELMGWEVAKAGATFADATSSPAAITQTYNTIKRAFLFSDIAVQYGGTVSKDGTTKAYSISGGTSLATVIDFEISIDMAKEQRVTLGSRYPRQVVAGQRTVSGSLTLRNDSPSLTFYDLLRAGTQQAIDILITGDADSIEAGMDYELQITIPLAGYNDGDVYGTLDTSGDARQITVPFTGLLYETTGDDIAVRFRNATASY